MSAHHILGKANAVIPEVLLYSNFTIVPANIEEALAGIVSNLLVYNRTLHKGQNMAWSVLARLLSPSVLLSLFRTNLSDLCTT